MVLEKTLRSGKTIRFAGDVMVYGDVNAGAHIEADGNIVVFGSLRGLAHAGARGDERAVIISFDLGSPKSALQITLDLPAKSPWRLKSQSHRVLPECAVMSSMGDFQSPPTWPHCATRLFPRDCLGGRGRN